MKNFLLSAIGLMILKPALAQDSTGIKKSLTLSGYAEVYYNHDFNRTVNNTAPAFLYNFNRTNEVNLNLAFIKANYALDRVRASFALAAGTYINVNYSAEPGVLKNVYEASIGIKLSTTHNLWIDAGIMPSHIGFESATGKDNWTLTRSMVAENTPYFESGVKLGFMSKDEKWYLAAMYLNGWQRIQRVDGNSIPALGTQATYKPSSAVTLNYSTFIGNDKADSLRQMRYYHNVYGIFQLTDKFGITAGFDYGMEQQAKRSSTYNRWLSPVLIVRYSPASRINFAARAEYFQDKNGVIISTGTAHGFRTYGISANVDYAVMPGVLWRLEVRNFNSKDALFNKNNERTVHSNAFVTSAVSIAF